VTDTNAQIAQQIIDGEVVYDGDLPGFDFGDLDQTPGGVSL